MINAPCKDCSNRIVGCHSTCEAYKQFQLENEAVRHQRHLETESKAYAINTHLERKRKVKRK